MGIQGNEWNGHYRNESHLASGGCMEKNDFREAECILKRNGGRMKVRWTGPTDFLILTHDKIYEVLAVEKEWYRIIDDSGEDYLYPPEMFEIVE